MPDLTYVYIDGESHYIRSEKAWQIVHGDNASLDQLRYVGDPDDRLVLVIPRAKVFWTRKMNPGATRAVYFTSASCDEPDMHKIKLSLRDFGLEPVVVHEPSKLAAQRLNLLNSQGVIEKPKLVDISLAVRMIHDAHHHAYETCHLYTSDVDFLPVIREVRGIGKQVYVHGYVSGLANQSPMLHEPDLFIDLERMMRTECELKSVI
jgi:uncharacterized LabA/DUF88 family protein